jgi:hypothetical protein
VVPFCLLLHEERYVASKVDHVKDIYNLSVVCQVFNCHGIWDFQPICYRLKEKKIKSYIIDTEFELSQDE